MTTRRNLAFCFLLLVSGVAHADSWDGFATFMAEFVIALPWSMLFLSINIAWVICRRAPGRGMAVLALLTVLGPLAVTWKGSHDVRDAASWKTIVVLNTLATAVALLPLAISCVRSWTARRRALRGPTLSDLPGTGSDANPMPASGPRWLGTALGWILVATGVAIGAFLLRLGLLSYLKDKANFEVFEVFFTLGELAAFAAPPAIIGTALIVRERKR